MFCGRTSTPFGSWSRNGVRDTSSIARGGVRNVLDALYRTGQSGRPPRVYREVGEFGRPRYPWKVENAGSNPALPTVANSTGFPRVGHAVLYYARFAVVESGEGTLGVPEGGNGVRRSVRPVGRRIDVGVPGVRAGHSRRRELSVRLPGKLNRQSIRPVPERLSVRFRLPALWRRITFGSRQEKVDV